MRGSSAPARASSRSRRVTGSPTWPAIWRAKTSSSARATAAVASGGLTRGGAAPRRSEPPGGRRTADLSPPRSTAAQSTGAPPEATFWPCEKMATPENALVRRKRSRKAASPAASPPSTRRLTVGRSESRWADVRTSRAERPIASWAASPARLTRAIPCSSANRSIRPSAATATAITARRTRPALRPMRRVLRLVRRMGVKRLAFDPTDRSDPSDRSDDKKGLPPRPPLDHTLDRQRHQRQQGQQRRHGEGGGELVFVVEDLHVQGHGVRRPADVPGDHRD